MYELSIGGFRELLGLERPNHCLLTDICQPQDMNA